MSVLSKALRLAVPFILLSACSVHQRQGASSSDVLNAEKSDVTPGDDALLSGSGSPTGTLTPEQLASLPVTPLTSVLDSGVDIQVQKTDGYVRFDIGTDSTSPKYEVFTMAQPARVVVDIVGPAVALNNPSGTFSVDGSDLVRSVRLGTHQDRTRVVFDLADATVDPEAVARQVSEAPGKIVVSLGTAQAPVPAIAKATIENTEVIASEESPVAEAVTQVASSGADALPVAESASIDTVAFEKTKHDSGTVTVGLGSDAPSFELLRSTPTEYALRISNATATERTTIPQIAPVSFPGIRSARAVQEGSGVSVRMFVDEGVTLRARKNGSNIIVSAHAAPNAASSDARAQLAPEPEKPAQPADAAAPEAEGAPQRMIESEDETARRNPTGVPSQDGSKVYTGRLISLDLQETDIDNALRIIAEVSNLNIIASDDVTGKVTLRLIDVPWDQALDVILKTNGLDQVTEGNVIRIAPVDKLRQEREALREAKKAAENLEDLKVKYIRVSYARASDLKEQVEAVLSERGSVTIDERTNQLIVKDIGKGQDETIQLIKRLDLRTPQVLLETQVVEASRSILRDLGFQWNFLYSESAATGNATGANFPNSIVAGGSGTGSGNAVNFPASLSETGTAITAVLDSADGSRALSMRLSALESESKVRVISRPQVATVNNKEAEIKSVETVRVRLPDSGLSVATGQGASSSGGGSTAFEEIDVGITLRVTPQASPDYYVLLDIYSKSSTFGPRTVDNIPSTLEREATSTILVKSGQTFALGGVYRINDNDRIEGVPWLKDLPVLGTFFRRALVDKTDEELIFFITPHIVEGSFDPSLM